MKKRWGLAGSLAVCAGLMLNLTGCMKVGPDFSPPQATVKDAWSDASDERVKTDPANYREWWDGFEDETLSRVIDLAHRQNISLKLAAVRVLEARAQLGIAVGGFFPQTQRATGNLTFNRVSEAAVPTTGSQAGNPGGSSVAQTSFWTDQIGLSSSWELDFWGKYRRGVESADASFRASLADYDTALVSLTADTAASYVLIRTLEKRLEIAYQNVKTAKASLQLAEVRQKGGTTTERDVEQAKTILFNTQSAIPLLESQLRQTKNALSVLLGVAPDGLADVLGGAAKIPIAPPTVAVGIPADLLRRRPDVRSAELQAAAQSAQIGVAKAQLFPAFSLTGTVGLSASDIGKLKLSDMFAWQARFASLGPSVQWNILNYGQITNLVRVQDARFQALLLSYQNAVLTAQREVEDSLVAFLRAQENAQYLAMTAEAAQRSLTLAFIQYREGSADFTTVLTAQQSLLSAQDSLASAMGSISTNLVGLYRAMGGGWQIREGQEILAPEIREVMAKRTNWGHLLVPAASISTPGEGSDIRLPDW